MSCLVTISGLPGSGTSTLSTGLVAASGRFYVNAGRIFRALALESGLSLAQFGERAEADPGIDRRLDARMVDLARQHPGAVLEGRVTGWMAHRHQLQALKVWVAADPWVRADRVSRRDGQSAATAIAAVQARETSERSRYADHYGIDLADMSIYDLVLNSNTTASEDLVRQVLTAIDAHTGVAS